MRKWEIKEKKDVSPSLWFPIERYKVKLPKGDIIDDYFVSVFPNIAMVLPITIDNKVVLVKQYKHGIQEVLIELPAGFQQKNKSVKASAIAELEEEVGIKAKPESLISLGKIGVAPTKTNLITYGYLATNLTFNSKQKLDLTEDIEIVLKSPSSVIEMVKSGEIWMGESVALIMKAYLIYPDLFI